MEKRIITHKVNPSLIQIGYSMHEYKKTIRNKGMRTGTVDGKQETIFKDERISAYEDRRIYFKFFKGQLERIRLLSKSAQELYFYILENKVEYGKHSFSMVLIEAGRDLKVSESTVNRSVKELLEEEIIYRTDMRFVFFLNLLIASFCDETKVYKEYTDLYHTKLRYQDKEVEELDPNDVDIK